MFLIIFEDGKIVKMKDVGETELEAAGDGYCDIIDITVPEHPTQYIKGEWHNIDV